MKKVEAFRYRMFVWKIFLVDLFHCRWASSTILLTPLRPVVPSTSSESSSENVLEQHVIITYLACNLCLVSSDIPKSLVSTSARASATISLTPLRPVVPSTSSKSSSENILEQHLILLTWLVICAWCPLIYPNLWCQHQRGLQLQYH